MPLAGRQLSIASALACCRSVGFSGEEELTTAVAVMTAESARYTAAFHVNPDGSTDRGIFQINDGAHPDLTDEAAYRAKPNARFARKLFKDQGWRPWMAHGSGAYAQFLPEVKTVYDRGRWRLRVPLWKAIEG